jgi:hypothetical protein
MKAGDAATHNNAAAADASIDADASLRDALNLLLNGAQRLAVEREGERIGTLGFDEVRSVLRHYRDKL